MAAHRKPPQRSFGGGRVRTAATIALAGAASATGFGATAHATPKPSPQQVKATVDRLYREAEIATQRYDGAKEKADRARGRVNALRDEAARRTDRLDTAREALGSAAAAQYRNGSVAPSVQLLLSSDPQRYLDDAAFAERVDGRQATAVTDVREQLREIERVRGAAQAQLATLASRQAELRRHKRTIEQKLGEARRLLSRLSRSQQARIMTENGGAGQTAHSALQAAKAPNARAAAAVAYAYGKLGSPYVWGATGPAAFDCSGLTQAAYRSAGVSLPRTTYAQIEAGRRVARSELRPGDLVFFYSGVSHVGIYVGNGQMIHAPHPSAPVRLAPVDSMPFAGATRVA
ncbi:C40 family peptidase, partial [Streptomyces sp. RY43-2]